MDKQDSVQRFLELIRRSHRGKFKIYIGMSAGVGKTYRMLQEAHQLLEAGVDVRIGYSTLLPIRNSEKMANTVMNVLKKTQDFLLRRRFLDRGSVKYFSQNGLQGLA